MGGRTDVGTAVGTSGKTAIGQRTQRRVRMAASRIKAIQTRTCPQILLALLRTPQLSPLAVLASRSWALYWVTVVGGLL
jgi:hypothetical protein